MELAKFEHGDRSLLWGKYVEDDTYRQLAEEIAVPKSTLQIRVTVLTRLLLDSLTAEVNDPPGQQ